MSCKSLIYWTSGLGMVPVGAVVLLIIILYSGKYIAIIIIL